jgi:adenine-specific DNA-methyltransferase
LGYLTAFFNSKVFRFAFKEYFPELLGDSRELSKVFFETVSVKEIDEESNYNLQKIVDEIQVLKSNGQATLKLETIIENYISNLYGLTEKEIDLIKASNS